MLVTGPSRAGKSTIARPLLRLCDRVAGRVLLDGIDLRANALPALYNLTLMPLETAIAEGTVAENIAYGSFEATRRQIGGAARAAHAEEFILSLPHDYDTVLGSGGTRLSGGQRQRIAIARALLRNTPGLPARRALDRIRRRRRRCAPARPCRRW